MSQLNSYLHTECIYFSFTMRNLTQGSVSGIWKVSASDEEHSELQKLLQYSPVKPPYAISNKLIPSRKEKAKPWKVDSLELHHFRNSIDSVNFDVESKNNSIH